MSLKQIHDALLDIKSDNSRIFKEERLGYYFGYLGEDFKKVIILACNPFLNFHMKKLDKFQESKEGRNNVGSDNVLLFNYLNYLSEKSGTSNEERLILTELASTDKETYDVVNLILKKDLNCGIGEKTVQKYTPEIPVFNVMLCEKSTEKNLKNIKYPALCQLKDDGGRILTFVEDGIITHYSRNGRLIDLFGYFDDDFKSCPNGVYDGEIIFYKDGKPLKRKASNGLMNKAIKGSIKQKEIDGAVIHLWDHITLSEFRNEYSDIGTLTRFEYLSKHLVLSHKITTIITNIVHSYEETIENFNYWIEQGFEGIVLKNIDSPYEAKRSKNWIKFKNEKDCDLRVIGFEPHSKKEGWIGSLLCESEDGLLQVSTGSGMGDTDRQKEPSEYLNKIVAIKFNEVIDSEGDKLPSLFLPIFQGIREDKTQADTYKEIIAK